MRRTPSFLRLLAFSPFSVVLACSSGSESPPAPPAATTPPDEAVGDDPLDPTKFVAADKLSKARYGHTATLLADGRVLVVGGETTTSPALPVEVFDEAASAWTTI